MISHCSFLSSLTKGHNDTNRLCSPHPYDMLLWYVLRLGPASLPSVRGLWSMARLYPNPNTDGVSDHATHKQNLNEADDAVLSVLLLLITPLLLEAPAAESEVLLFSA